MLFLSSETVIAQNLGQPSLRGTVTDPSGAAIRGAEVQLRGPGPEQNQTTNEIGEYSFSPLRPGKYQIGITATGFSVAQRNDLTIDRPTVLNLRLAIQSVTQTVGVQGENGGVNTNPESNGSAVVMGRKQLAALSDDPDELAQELQAMAGPAPGPNGSQVFIDGFTGGNLPPKSEIRKILINANPWSAEDDSPGFGRIEIITKPGSNDLHGDLFGQYNDEYLNSRDPLLPQSTRPPYQVQFYGLDLTGPLKANRASFTLDAEHRDISDNALILATTLDSNLNPVPISEAVATPQTRTTISSSLDYAINANNSLMLRYQHVGIGMTNEGVGGFNLPSRAYDETSTENTIQATETAILNPKIVNETRFQFMRTTVQNTGNDTTPGIDVIGAFYGGGPTIGNSRSVTDEWEIANGTTFRMDRIPGNGEAVCADRC